jgi:hypothetical protein
MRLFEIRVQTFTSNIQTVGDYRGKVVWDLRFHDILNAAASAQWEDPEY